MGAIAEHKFGESGGSIGRSKGNTWCLPDPGRVVSGTHAEIRYFNGEYYIKDTSTNGTLLNSVQMSNGDERPLRNGDVIRIGKFDISVEAQAASIPSAAPPEPDPFLGSPLPTPTPGRQGETLDPLELIGGGAQSNPVDLPPEGFDFAADTPQSDHAAPEAMGFEPPKVIADPNPMQKSGSGMEIPEHWDETGFGASPTKEPPPVATSNPPQPFANPGQSATVERPVIPATLSKDEPENLAAMLRAAGVPPDSVSPATYAVLGQIFGVVVQGLVDVLRARAHIKDEFRVTATRMKPVENNPLKFSINAQDAMHNLFGKSNPGYQSPVDAFRDSFEDVKAHQMAMIAGMRAAYQKVLQYFDPEGLEAEFDKGLKRGVLGGVLNKTKYWDLYEDLYAHLSKDPDESFQRLFGEEFGRAYEEQMERLSNIRKT